MTKEKYIFFNQPNSIQDKVVLFNYACIHSLYTYCVVFVFFHFQLFHCLNIFPVLLGLHRPQESSSSATDNLSIKSDLCGIYRFEIYSVVIQNVVEA